MVLDLGSFVPKWPKAELFNLTLQHACWVGKKNHCFMADADPCNNSLSCFAGKQKHPGAYILRWRPHTCSGNATSDIERTTTVQVWKSVADFVLLSPFVCACARASDIRFHHRNSDHFGMPPSACNFVSLPWAQSVSALLHLTRTQLHSSGK